MSWSSASCTRIRSGACRSVTIWSASAASCSRYVRLAGRHVVERRAHARAAGVAGEVAAVERVVAVVVQVLHVVRGDRDLLRRGRPAPAGCSATGRPRRRTTPTRPGRRTSRTSSRARRPRPRSACRRSGPAAAARCCPRRWPSRPCCRAGSRWPLPSSKRRVGSLSSGCASRNTRRAYGSARSSSGSSRSTTQISASAVEAKTSRPLTAPLPARTRIRAPSCRSQKRLRGGQRRPAGTASVTATVGVHVQAGGEPADQRGAGELGEVEVLRHPGPQHHLVADGRHVAADQRGERAHEDEDAVGGGRVAVGGAGAALQEEAVLVGARPRCGPGSAG